MSSHAPLRDLIFWLAEREQLCAVTHSDWFSNVSPRLHWDFRARSELETKMAEVEAEQTSSGILQEIFTSPLNLSLLCLCLYLLYKIFRGDKPADVPQAEESLPKLKKRDLTLADLKQYDGVTNPRILMAVCGKVFDVTRGKSFYGPGDILCTQNTVF